MLILNAVNESHIRSSWITDQKQIFWQKSNTELCKSPEVFINKLGNMILII